MKKELIVSLAELCAKFDKTHGRLLKKDFEPMTKERHEANIIMPLNRYSNRGAVSIMFGKLRNRFSIKFYPLEIAEKFSKELNEWVQEHSEELAIDCL